MPQQAPAMAYPDLEQAIASGAKRQDVINAVASAFSAAAFTGGLAK